MAIIKFPLISESAHPQYKWNEQEFIIRMLHQHKIGISLNETLNDVTISFDPTLSLNFVAKGAVDFQKYNANRTFTTSTANSKWIYLAADGSRFYEDAGTKPTYNQYLHGWYRSNGDRAVIFIDPDQGQGFRSMLMDTFNCHFDYEQRIPDTGGELFWRLDSCLDYFRPSPIFTPGSYRFEITGGKGGKGGGRWLRSWGYEDSSGGNGCYGQSIVYKLNIYTETLFEGVRGGEGQKGAYCNSVNWTTGNLLFGYKDYCMCTGASGASSGGDSRVRTTGNISVEIINAIGGAGGGGRAPAPMGNAYNWTAEAFSRAGGGGAGYYDGFTTNRDGENDTWIWRTPYPLGGKGGGLTIGGSSGNLSRIWGNIPFAYGDAGENRDGRLRRNGGNSYGLYGEGHSVGTAYGGNTFQHDNSSKFEVYRIKKF